MDSKKRKNTTQLSRRLGARSLKRDKTRKARTAITIEQIAEAIRGGAFNYPTVAAKVGASAQTVMKKIKEEGAKVGITSVGQKAAFRLMVK